MSGRGGTSYTVDPLEMNFELRFPNSVAVYDTMRSQDAHVGSTLSAIILPFVRAKWDLLTEGVRPEVVALVRSELGINGPSKPRQRRRREGISWLEHVEQAAETMLWAGFCPFEQVYSVSGPRPGQEATGLETVVHLRKLAPRLPRTIAAVNVARDGGLVSVEQTNPEGADNIVLPVDRLVYYVNKREGADWYGRSILRQAYKHWLIKDVLLRLDAQAAERNSMGIPVVYYGDESDKTEAENFSSQLRAGATAGLALKNNMTLKIQGVEGSTVDLTPKIEYQDREIARSVLAMFLDLGHDNGARSLGETLLDVFMDSVQAIADKVAETATEHIVRDLVELNYGPDEPYPMITPGDLKTNGDIVPEALKLLVDAGLVVPDDKLEAHVRNRFNLPEAEPDTARSSAESDAGDMLTRTNQVGVLIRSGFDPEEAMKTAGLAPVKHLGLLPVTVQPPAAGTDLDNAVPPVEDGEAGKLSADHPEHGSIDDMLATVLAMRQARLSRQSPAGGEHVR